ncbi:MAG: ATP-binding protein [Bacteroidales bacterium]|nr:ATP-binding protein [Bacteroidales bacterium]
MIVQVSIDNILSFNSETTISFVASKSDLLPFHVARAIKRDDISILKTGLIYGANGSGKSNVIKCIELLREFVVFGKPQKMLEPFKLAAEPRGISKIEAEFKVGDKYYAYGVAYGKKNITEEWLYQIGSREGKPIFERTVTEQEDSIQLSPALVKHGTKEFEFISFLAVGTPKDKTFLHEYVIRNGKGIDAIKSVYDWFMHMQIIFPNSRNRNIAVRVLTNQEFKNATKALLNLFGTGVADLKRVAVKPEEIGLLDEFRQDMEQKLIKQGKGGLVVFDGVRFYYVELHSDQNIAWKELRMVHKADDGSERIFNITEESDGTIRLLDFIPMLIDMRTNDAVYLIDEVDRSMHPMMTVKLIELYNKIIEDRKDCNLQLICTTHESTLLSEAQIRNDEVWFVEKDEHGASHMTSLVEYKPRQDVRRGYLMGRYGAIPFFGNLDNINW